MKKELNELTEDQARKIADLFLGEKFVSFRCDETSFNTGGFVVRIELKNNRTLHILTSGNVFLLNGRNHYQSVNAMFITDYLRSQGFNLPNEFDAVSKIQNYFKNMPEEKLAEFKEIVDKYAGVGPNVQDFIKDQEEFFNMVTKEELQQSVEEIDKMELGGPSVEEYFSKFPKKFLELIKSGKIEKTEEMAFSREGVGGYKLIDDPNLNFNLIEVNAKTIHPLKKVEEGIRIYRVLDGYGAFYIQENSIVENEIYFEVKYDDVILIKAGDSYRYEKGLGNKLNLFEINIKYP